MAPTRSNAHVLAEVAGRRHAGEVAAGHRPADTVLRGGRVVDVFNRRIAAADVAIGGERIAAVGDVSYTVGEATEMHDCAGLFVLPGFVEPHLHVGSSQLTVERLAEVLVPRGTVAYSTCFYEPAVIAGAAAVDLLIDRSAGTGLDLLLSPFLAAVRTGAATTDDVLRWVADDRCVEIREWSWTVGLDGGPGEVYAEALRRGRVVAGHLEGLDTRLVQASAALGCRSDHETATAEEALQRARAGVVVQIREGSAARDLRAVARAVTEHGADPACFALCTDEQELASLVEDGHLDHKLRLAVRQGIAPLDAVRMATLNSARSMGVDGDYGAVAPGRFASLALVEDLGDWRVRRVYARGRLAAEDHHYLLAADPPGYPPEWSDTIAVAGPLSASDFLLAPAGATLRVIGFRSGSLLTEELHEDVRLDAGRLAPGQGLAKVAVIDRHQRSGRIGLAVALGLDIAHGAFAATVNPGTSNLMVAGVDEHDMARAANRVIELGGGIVVARDGEVRAEAALPLLGIFSDEPSRRVAAACVRVDRALREDLGCPHPGVLTTVGFGCLASAIPRLKVCDSGLMRVTRGAAPEPVGLDVD
ncbi:adenine deaminase C-terminal domain-containing protein [Pseudonocardia acaciae]|uniref:adenine deaminase C-terminal domain-containing protein n=1 Tax=Pseudonocardia acaciae TaxID=551276 RepID=UPI000490C330|nr:adenine deaminase C-terminal domain-containing protein [Pseudonocardia acaciae]